MTRKRDTKLIDWIARMAGLSRGQRQELHREITGQHLSKDEILERAREIKELYPRK
jgi:hypothetical protein